MTAQASELLIYAGTEMSLRTEPLAGIIEKRLRKAGLRFKPQSSANWRGYLGHWEIQDCVLKLNALGGALKSRTADNLPLSLESPLAAIFPNVEQPIIATWYTGTLHAQLGQCIRYVHSGHESTYEYDWYFEILEGKLMNHWITSNHPTVNYSNRKDMPEFCI